MRLFIRVFIAGFVISFLGSLPLATMNVAAMQISISDSVGSAMLFSLGSLTVEMIYVRLSLVALNWIRKQRRLFRVLEYVTILIVLVLAASSFYAALHPSVGKNIVLSSTLPKFLLGASMCAVSPGQIPFWIGWSTVLLEKKVLLPQNRYYNIYIAGIGIGTFIGNCLFIFGGQLIANRISKNQHIVHWVIGFIFLITAFLQAVQTFRKKGAAEKIQHPEELKKKWEPKL
jgi:threonine/homoserine/homoserine lactone efflux protein